ncbi:MAG: hypothetical protein H6744_03890 [Deltaproteobacteria bacterium]|nr:hypothetical protein [Deltaproteobacteria bacterium]MCB9785818.1 hypothetical protein [Deltaproteobacteria bacterium]
MTCTDEVRLASALPDPVHRPDREGEWLELRSDAPVPLWLDGWTLRSGRARLALDGLAIGPGASLCLDSAGPGTGRVQLRNHDGSVALVDPCGVTRSSLRWAEARPGVVIRADPPWPGDAVVPARRALGGDGGGCGQT